jgi:hypothetical protein
VYSAERRPPAGARAFDILRGGGGAEAKIAYRGGGGGREGAGWRVLMRARGILRGAVHVFIVLLVVCKSVGNLKELFAERCVCVCVCVWREREKEREREAGV